MKLNVNFFATLRRVTGTKTVEFDLPDEVTAGQVLDAVIERFPDMRADLLDENGELHRHCHMFINGRGVPFLLEKMDTVVRPGDTVNIFPAVGGGEDPTALGGGDSTSGGGDGLASESYVYAIPLWLLRDYLEELGGTVCSDTMVAGDGWVAELTRLPDHQVGSLRTGRVQVTVEGDADSLAALRPGLDRKTLRAGG